MKELLMSKAFHHKKVRLTSKLTTLRNFIKNNS